jgi:two-component system, NarL family, sensor kinase
MTNRKAQVSKARMTGSSAPIALPENTAELRALYRAAEARAARLRVLVEAGQSLAATPADALDEVAARLASDAAHLAGFERGRLVFPPEQPPPSDENLLVLALPAPGGAHHAAGWLVLEDRCGEAAAEDHKTLSLLAQLIGASFSARARENRLARLLGELLSIQENERSRIAHELHDGVAQSAAALMRRVELAADGDPADLTVARDQARALVEELRRVIAGMRPPVLDDLGLVPALGQLAEEARAKGLIVELRCAGAARPQPMIETAIFRIAQEALNNAAAHAGPATHVAVLLEDVGDRLRLQVRDNGCGFDPDAPIAGGGIGGLGLAYMRERIELLGGELTIRSAPGAGCTILAELSR